MDAAKADAGLTLKILRLRAEDGSLPPMPALATEGAAGFDVCAFIREPVTVAALAEELATAGSAYFHDKSPYGLAFYSFNDYIEQRDSNQMIATVVNVFCLLFAVILALIAMANVFNTVTNSLILRRREFAVMKSVGLSNRQFRAMVAEECVAWCIRGLVPGVLLSLLVSFLLWQVISGSMTGLPFTLPWNYVALAAAMTVVAVGASVAYGMHRCRADNVVEALRADAV